MSVLGATPEKHTFPNRLQSIKKYFDLTFIKYFVQVLKNVAQET